MRYLILHLCLLLSVAATGQRSSEVGLFLGAANYQGDFSASPISLNKTGAAFGAIYQHFIDPNWGVKGAVTYGRISGNDANLSAETQHYRGWSFKAGVLEMAGQLQFHPFGKARFYDYGMFRQQVSPFVAFGLGLAFADAKVTRSADDKRTFPEPDDRGVFISIPISAGIRWVMTEKWTLTGEFGQRAIFSDYLDSVSKNGTTGTNDWYMFLGLGLTYTLMAEY